MSDTPRMNAAAGVPTRNSELVAERCYEAGCELERENAKLREALSNLIDACDGNCRIQQTALTTQTFTFIAST